MPNTDGGFAGKVAFVTGAASGIGRATALAFARDGADVGTADISAEANHTTARLIEEAGGCALAVACDVTRSESVGEALGSAVETFGRVDVAFNNAGIEQPNKPAAAIAEDEWDRLVAVNLRGVFISMQQEIPVMLQYDGGGAIVNTSSGAGVKGAPPTPRQSTASSGSPNQQHSTTRPPTSASTPSAPASSTPR